MFYNDAATSELLGFLGRSFLEQSAFESRLKFREPSYCTFSKDLPLVMRNSSKQNKLRPTKATSIVVRFQIKIDHLALIIWISSRSLTQNLSHLKM